MGIKADCDAKIPEIAAGESSTTLSLKYVVSILIIGFNAILAFTVVFLSTKEVDIFLLIE